jgi:hypothetical protein
MKAKDLLALTAGQHALQAALCAKLETALDECHAARDAADYVEKCLRVIEAEVLSGDQRPGNQPMWPTHVAHAVLARVKTLEMRIESLEADLSSACAKVQQ